ncbi:NADH dehydrogenase [ubiquinone] 1 beta subcomplex subunit 10 [Centropristis striata]|uniref:NADH dehydrogenase [ubiquinone] 1 beta subcomplex subunit 10 n=1 Tax=Centropristis striata TaxID=184440 RepID=UPI0027E09DE2|nr:NADH dehydrogenase [ubiquinone] 1 beta subcomplex subunit 10 [Centropristis striata]
MPTDHDERAYPEPPTRTPAENRQSSLPDPYKILASISAVFIDLPVVKFRGFIESLRSDKKMVYYHQKFRRVPYLTSCEQGDFLCYYEAEMQWRRDFKVDQEILGIMQERMRACYTREGDSWQQNCAKTIQDFDQTARNYQSRYGDLGVYASARKCLMKQKERMMEAQAQSS